MYVRPKLTFVSFLCFFLHLSLRSSINFAIFSAHNKCSKKSWYLPNYLKKEDIQYTQKYLEIPENTHEYPELPESKKDTRIYPIVYFSTLTRPEPDPLPGIFSNTWPDPTRYWKTLPVGHWSEISSLLVFSARVDRSQSLFYFVPQEITVKLARLVPEMIW